MSAMSFRSVFMVASCAGAALGCYLVSLRVASERAALEQVEQQIVMAERDIRVLQTEIGTRGRLAQLERWNVRVLALSAPTADQFVGGGFELARMIAPQRKVDFEAPVVLAAAPAEKAVPVIQDAEDEAPEGSSARDLLHTASLTKAPREVREPVTRAAAANRGQEASAGTPASRKKPVDKPAASARSTVTKTKQLAKVDPLAPLPEPPSKPRSKDRGQNR